MHKQGARPAASGRAEAPKVRAPALTGRGLARFAPIWRMHGMEAAISIPFESVVRGKERCAQQLA
ncbi:hypothetical protein CO709_26145 [Burkholderia thailandensis]|nr:hypothetical protein CO709_26145 [Burkholderia thailandensis]